MYDLNWKKERLPEGHEEPTARPQLTLCGVEPTVVAMAKLEWNVVDDDWHHQSLPKGFTYRAKVPGGWLVSVWAGDAKNQRWGGGLTFLPDPTYGWEEIAPNVPSSSTQGA